MKILKELFLGFNALEELSEEVFTPLISLELINLEHNRLKVISVKELNALKFLSYFDISSNEISSIEDKESLKNLKHLSRVFASGNICSDKDFDDFQNEEFPFNEC